MFYLALNLKESPLEIMMMTSFCTIVKVPVSEVLKWRKMADWQMARAFQHCCLPGTNWRSANCYERSTINTGEYYAFKRLGSLLQFTKAVIVWRN
jgi:hypothetical protein